MPPARGVSLQVRMERLEQRVEDLKNEADELSVQHKAILLRCVLLSSWCEGLQIYRSRKAAVHAAAANAHAHTNSRSTVDPHLNEQETSLLQQLDQSSACSLASSHADTVLDLETSTTAPPSRPMQYFVGIMQLQPIDVAGSTVQQIAQDMRDLVTMLSIHLSQLGAESAEHANPSQALKQLLDRFIHLACSMVLGGREDLVADVVTYNLESLESDAAFLEAATQRTFSMAPDLQLTQQQCDTLSTGVELYFELLQGNQQEQQSVQAQLAAVQLASTGISGSSAAARAHVHVQQLEQQQELYQRLQALLQKEYLLQFIMCGWTVGCLSYQQLARAFVLAWPFLLRLSHLAIGIQRWHRQRQQQQQGQTSTEQQPAAAAGQEPL